ncbi:hypothetical protein EIP91_005138 [Steccherinum ochraceum]|uniref:Uncharacterized protein n=1 Tax=Steccherinum ochraceum TaxID=92696 RepID=A0A4R0RIP0_9APHY|nr:hypothetical protein EIP91_005138 [Steccherinum ochraceum]
MTSTTSPQNASLPALLQRRACGTGQDSHWAILLRVMEFATFIDIDCTTQLPEYALSWRLVCSDWRLCVDLVLRHSLVFSSKKDLDTLESFATCEEQERNARHLKTFGDVRSLVISPRSADQSWVTLVPILVNRIRHQAQLKIQIDNLVLKDLDLTSYPSAFHKSFSLLKGVSSLDMHRVRYSAHTQFTSLASAVHARYLHLKDAIYAGKITMIQPDAKPRRILHITLPPGLNSPIWYKTRCIPLETLVSFSAIYMSVGHLGPSAGTGKPGDCSSGRQEGLKEATGDDALVVLPADLLSELSEKGILIWSAVEECFPTRNQKLTDHGVGGTVKRWTGCRIC